MALRLLTMTAVAALVAAMFMPQSEHFWRGFCEGVALGVLIALLVSLFSPEVTAEIGRCEAEMRKDSALQPREKA